MLHNTHLIAGKDRPGLYKIQMYKKHTQKRFTDVRLLSLGLGLCYVVCRRVVWDASVLWHNDRSYDYAAFIRSSLMSQLFA